MHDMIDWSKPRRQSKVVILLSLLKLFKTVLFALLLLATRFVFNKNTGSENTTYLLYGISAIILIYIFVLINDVIRFYFYTFCILDQQLIIYSGFLIKNKTELPLSKIQAIHTRQTFLHRLTNTCRLTIDTAGSEKSEMNIEALDINISREFIQALAIKQSGYIKEKLSVKNTDEAPQHFLRLTFKDVIKLCISENHLKTFLILIGFLIGKMQDIREYLGFDSFGWMQQHTTAANTTAQAVILVIIIGMLFSILISCVRVILRFYGFTVELRRTDFIIKWGLLETQHKHIPFKKVQLLSWRSTFVRRLMGMSLLRLHATAEDENKENQMIQVPITHANQLTTIANYYQPVLPASHFQCIGIQSKFIIRRILLVGLPVTFILGIVLYYTAGWYWLLTVIWLVYFGVSTYLYQQNFKLWISDEAIQIERGIWGRINVLVNLANIQQVAIKSSPYKRKHQLADIKIYTPGINVNIPFLKKDEAAFIADFILANIEFKQEINRMTTKNNAMKPVNT